MEKSISIEERDEMGEVMLLGSSDLANVNCFLLDRILNRSGSDAIVSEPLKASSHFLRSIALFNKLVIKVTPWAKEKTDMDAIHIDKPTVINQADNPKPPSTYNGPRGPKGPPQPRDGAGNKAPGSIR